VLHENPAEVRFEIAEQDLPSCLRAADFLNRNDSSKYSDRSAFKSAMTGVARSSRSHLERLSASLARQHSYVGGGNTPYHLPRLQRIIT
jgi:hypothetical protein